MVHHGWYHPTQVLVPFVFKNLQICCPHALVRVNSCNVRHQMQALSRYVAANLHFQKTSVGSGLCQTRTHGFLRIFWSTSGTFEQRKKNPTGWPSRLRFQQPTGVLIGTPALSAGGLRKQATLLPTPCTGKVCGANDAVHPKRLTRARLGVWVMPLSSMFQYLLSWWPFVCTSTTFTVTDDADASLCILIPLCLWLFSTLPGFVYCTLTMFICENLRCTTTRPD